MTTIVGIQGDGFCVVCVDSRISDVDDSGVATQIATLRDSTGKVAVNGKYLLGAAGDLRAINILHHAFQPPTPAVNIKGKKLDQFVTTKFIPALRECFETQGYASPQNEQSEHMAEHNSTIIMSINGVIYIIDGDYSWISGSDGVFAVGTGAQFALGALQCLIPKYPLSIQTAKKIGMKALTIAAKFDPYTGPPYQTLSQGVEKKARA
jgi:ATP-dependent protease HslVU (ClpYQ) peptidase subunit